MVAEGHAPICTPLVKALLSPESVNGENGTARFEIFHQILTHFDFPLLGMLPSSAPGKGNGQNMKNILDRENCEGS